MNFLEIRPIFLLGCISAAEARSYAVSPAIFFRAEAIGQKSFEIVVTKDY